ncbi:Spermatogenesis- and oogenesis-specific basic helix-loop-helix-containing protein 1 [Merluccius polli]|uniref:Spermatogenesis- and oogenesis-specific basic helix-loop-helix-containing protein 1 n=1 Tax=Merluccius polli TaxID=89951 RepID=A0AA47MWC5_MERPO|nr:Spermatogenesis- and oogenesis-specific basic helix-loop-helix-containing protein 1 [Merluccius polli]
MALLHTEDFGTHEACVAPDATTTTFGLSSPGSHGTPERPASSPCGPGPLLSTPPVQQEMVEEEEEEEKEGLNDFQRTMKIEHRQALRNSHRGCVILERHRRKRITQSCSRLRQLLPTIPGGRVDMVTVLEMTVAYLETIKQVSAQRPDIQLCPPVDVHANWLMQSHMTWEQGHKLATELESKLRSPGTLKVSRWVLRKKRRERREDME